MVFPIPPQNAAEQPCIRDQFTALLMEISANAIRIADKDTFFKTSLRAIGQTMCVSRTYVFGFSGQDTADNTYEWVAPGVEPQQQVLQNLTPAQCGEAFEQLLAGHTVCAKSLDELDPVSRDFLARQHILALLITPLFQNGNVVGLFGFDICSPGMAWPENALDLILSIADILSNALAHFQLLHKLERKNRQLDVILDAFTDLVYISDMDTHKVLFANRALCEQFPQDVCGSVCYASFQGLEAPCPYCTNHILRHQNEPYIWMHHSPVLERTYRVVDRAIPWDDGRRVRLSIATDVTAVLAAQRDKNTAEAASQAKGDFLARMSHEIRTPMNGILGFTHLALEAVPPQPIDNYLRKIHAASSNLLGIINDILDFSKIEAGKIELEECDFDFQELLQNLENIIAVQIRNKGVALSCVCDADVPRYLKGDSLRINQILLNLLNNAAKFTERGSIRLHACRDERDGEMLLHICVRDTGIGVPPDKLETLFESFVQGDDSISRRFGGTGLGLSISKQLALLMLGDLWYEQAPDGGSIFHLLLPCRTGTKPDSALPKALTNAEALRGKRVLLVEDNDINQEIASELLKKKGMLVDIADNGLRALECVARKTYDLVLMDIQMPDMDGLTATRRMRAQETPGSAKLPIIAMTAHACSGDRQKSLEAGMNDYVSKPFDPAELETTLLRWLR